VPILRRAGFTLVEMLVAVTLVLLMMTMFAQVFQMAGSSISKQRGLAENDQRSRTLQTIIKADLDKRTMRWVYPFAAGEDVSAPESYIGKRQGYLYISENNPTNKVDDNIQFTVMSSIISRNRDQSPYYGKASNLTSFGNSLNQPDADDAQASVNNTGLSTVAEIAYFVRNGNLYRRQLLIREPLSTFASNPQPTDFLGNLLFDPNSANPLYSSTGPFWNDYDYTAYMGFSGAASYANFLGSDSLDNSGKTIAGVAIAKPQFRFGFSPVGVAGVFPGRPKEFTDASTTASYIGRFTMQETSSTNFRYPQAATSGNNIPTSPGVSLTLDPIDATVTGPDDFSGGARRGEDLLLSNVHAFDITVWDTNANSFVNIGDPSLPPNADFAQVKRSGVAGASYGPRVAENAATNAINAVYDTWNPQIGIDFNGDGVTPEPPPFRPITFRPDYTTGTEPTPVNTAGTSAWQPNQSYAVGDIVFPTAANNPAGSPFYYRCISSFAPNKSGPGEPIWPKADSLNVSDGALVWQAIDNRKPLKAIKIEIRFVDPSTQQMRQLTIIQSLVD
jgi:prepilin-type N-terminal cleavage/methylation domain-containing protein